MKQLSLITIWLACTALTNPTYATSYLCIPEAAAAVKQDSQGFSSGASDASQKKFILSNASGSWQVRSHMDNMILFDSCETEFFCENSAGFAGVFWRERQNNAFTAVWLSGPPDGATRYVSVGKGRCSEI